MRLAARSPPANPPIHQSTSFALLRHLVRHSTRDAELLCHCRCRISGAQPLCPERANAFANLRFVGDASGRAAQHDDNFAARRTVTVVRAQLRHRSPPDLLELLRHFTRHDRASISSPRGLEIGERLNDAPWSLI